MRATLLSTLLLSALLAACATERDSIANKNISQQGTLKVHPSLVDKSAPAPAPESVTPAAPGTTAPR
jgi:peptidoglycan-associated lipoprotein